VQFLDGWEVMRALRRSPKTSGTFIIVVSGDAAPESIARSRAAGCDVFVKKPCVPEHLVAEVLRWSERGRSDV
jgi:CheY-like chemotaxis protein